MKAFQCAFSVLRPCTLLVLVAGAVACSESDAKPPTPPTLQIEAVALSGGAEWSREDGGKLELELGCMTEQLTVTVGPSHSAYQLGEWELRASDTCDSDESCGHLLLTIEGSEGRIEKLSARRFIEASSDELPGLGSLSVGVELVDDSETPIEADDGPVADSLDIEIVQDEGCESSRGE